MNEENNRSVIRESHRIIFLFIEMFSIGVFSSLFLTAYLTFDEPLFNSRLAVYRSWNLYVWILAFLVSVIHIFLLGRKSGGGTDEDKVYSSESRPFFIFLVFSGLAALAYIFQLSFNIINFLAFLTAVYSLISTARFYIFSFDRPAWRHPTTAGGIFQGTVALGAGTGLLIYHDPALQTIYAWILIVILALESLSLWSRFLFLNRTSPITRQSVKMMLGTYFSLFGIRFIFGLIMPIVYLIWVLIFADLPLQPVAVMILVGEFSERWLFFTTSPRAVNSGNTISDSTSNIEQTDQEK
ncbi:MAG: hypothetical protein P8184_08270 [Calditrichia bacterium]